MRQLWVALRLVFFSLAIPSVAVFIYIMYYILSLQDCAAEPSFRVVLTVKVGLMESTVVNG